MPRVEKLDDLQRAEIFHLFKNTLIPTYEIMRKFKIHRDHYKAFNALLIREFGQAFFEDRKTRCYASSKVGNKNPMTGKHPATWNLGEPVADGKGYLMVYKPEWYTGRPGSKYVFQHNVVMCELLGLTELPDGFAVHHIDGNKTNNDPNNLALMLMSGHSRLHSILKKLAKSAETIREE